MSIAAVVLFKFIITLSVFGLIAVIFKPRG